MPLACPCGRCRMCRRRKLTRQKQAKQERQYRRWNRNAERERKSEAIPAAPSSQRVIDEAVHFLARYGGNRPHAGRVRPDRQADHTESRIKS